MTKRPVALIAAPITADAIAAMFRALTGREPTPGDMRAVADMLREHGEALGDGHDGGDDAGENAPQRV